MSGAADTAPPASIDLLKGFLGMAVAVAAFTLAYDVDALGFFIFFFLFGVLMLARLGTNRRAFYFGLTTGTLCYGIQLEFFYHIFDAAAMVLWLILGLWLALFVLLARMCLTRFKPAVAVSLIPLVWTGLEYFRSELYYLRFSWLNVGYALSYALPLAPFHTAGVYGVGFLAVGLAGAIVFLPRKTKLPAGLAIAGLWLGLSAFDQFVSPRTLNSAPPRSLQVAGIQMEFPSESEVIVNLNQVIKEHPGVDLVVLSEYTFDGAVPEHVTGWCRKHQRYLIAGGKDPAGNTNYFNTAFVVDRAGQIVFRQAKSVPIQFFKDGLPAVEQKLWHSPWGEIGICICYDLSYTRVVDRLIQSGAQALIVPTMDVEDWGRHEHELHKRVAIVRGAEYGVPIFRVASSGISQSVDPFGLEQATAPFPGSQATILGELGPGQAGGLPFDRLIAPASVAVTATVIGWLAFTSFRNKSSRPPLNDSKI